NKFRSSSKAGMYGDFLVMVDAMIGRVREALDKAGMNDDTLLFFTSDNGPVWYDTDVQRLDHDSVGGLRGMKADAWEGGHRMPFIVRWPGKIQAGSVSGQTICFTDMLATFAAVVDAELPPDAGPDSFDILPVLLGKQPESKAIRGPLVIPARRGMMSIRSGHWKLITGLGSGGFSKPAHIKPTPGGPKGQLYHLGNDLAETRNLYTEKPETVKSLRSKLAQILNQTKTRP
ncbi:MAG: sulfatase-like hydrolase/transferase, partial [Verrucomicrobia bacterium]|nr:sulfatase-like hydrolase/transferase [Verrucomicrobiota bacterium]